MLQGHGKGVRRASRILRAVPHEGVAHGEVARGTVERHIHVRDAGDVHRVGAELAVFLVADVADVADVDGTVVRGAGCDAVQQLRLGVDAGRAVDPQHVVVDERVEGGEVGVDHRLPARSGRGFGRGPHRSG
jgi:hypothetical protein